ncbi:hypothetical protein [Lysinibacillus fusiformis]|uniref:hypothetical protein n=1 Tax=Lysinibacillus fusiformis TaxID=28031 RepID=UPI003CFDE5BF
MDVTLFYVKTNQTVSEIFDREIRTFGCPVKMVDEIPVYAILINEHTDDEIISLAGNPLNIVELNKQLALLIPTGFPKFWIDYNNEAGNTDIFLEKMPSPEEEKTLKDKIKFLTAVISPIKFHLDAEVEKWFPSKTHDPLSINVSNHASNSFSKILLDKWEEDEQLWSDSKHILFKEIDSEIVDRVQSKVYRTSQMLYLLVKCEIKLRIYYKDYISLKNTTYKSV